MTNQLVEYVCTECGLVWFGERLNLKSSYICPECDSNNKEEINIYTCDDKEWFFVEDKILNKLKKNNIEIHYHKNHPWYEEAMNE